MTIGAQTMGDWIEDGDYRIENHGSVFVVYPQNADAKENIRENAGLESMYWGDGLVVEPRYVWDLVQVLNNEGWRVI